MKLPLKVKELYELRQALTALEGTDKEVPQMGQMGQQFTKVVKKPFRFGVGGKNGGKTRALIGRNITTITVALEESEAKRKAIRETYDKSMEATKKAFEALGAVPSEEQKQDFGGQQVAHSRTAQQDLAKLDEASVEVELRPLSEEELNLDENDVALAPLGTIMRYLVDVARTEVDNSIK